MEATAAVAAFCTAIGLPAPTHIVNSGSGIHCYWATGDFIDQPTWLERAQQFKSVTAAYGLKADPARTSDIASVLRMPGTRNYKYSPPKPVELVHAAEQPLSRDHLLQCIDAAYGRLCVAEAALAQPANRSGSSGFSVPPDLAQLSAALRMLDPDCDEPTWSLRRIAPMAREARLYPDLTASLYAIARTWSSGELRGQPSSKWHAATHVGGRAGAEVFDAAWQRFLEDERSDSDTTLGTIFHDATLVGWDAALSGFERTTTTVQYATDPVEEDKRLLDMLLKAVAGGDVGAPFEDAHVRALARLLAANQAEYRRYRGRLKSANSKVALGELDKAIKLVGQEQGTAQTHHGYAKDILDRLTVAGWAPITHEGRLYSVDPATNVWIGMEQEDVARIVAQTHDGDDFCARGGDYAAVAKHAFSLASDKSFFDRAPIGLACPGGFYRVIGNEAVVEPLGPEHLQRVQLSFSPNKEPTPLFAAFLHETFKSDVPGEEQQQIDLLQEQYGSTMLGIAHRYQKAFLWHDPIGRAGKGTCMSILERLVPSEFTSAVDPFTWDHEYYRLNMAGKRLNVVGELPDDKPIPASHFKSVIGGDLLSGRNPMGRPVSFRNSAGHVFMSNHVITSKDNSEAFFARWILLRFPNSRLLTGAPQDPLLATRIIEHELPGIAQWALDGALRLLANGAFSQSIAHTRLMEEWRRGNSSLDEFVHDACVLGQSLWVKRSTFYQAYVYWCKENGRKAMAKKTVYNVLAANLRLGIQHASLNGYDLLRGVDLKAGTFVPDRSNDGFAYQPGK